MDPVSIGFAVGGAILGNIGMRKKRREERRRRAREKKHALAAQTSLINSIGGLRDDYRERAGFARQDFNITQQGAIQGYQGERSAMDTLVGNTGMSYSGGAMEKSNRLDSAFKNQLTAQRLGAEQQMSSITKGFQSELRDVQVGLLNLERTSSERGYSIPSMGASFNTNPSGLGGVV
tara:strand:+ start:905 stop:1435 length:531 start_codon:yes stop_codon:yes gene_type:complete